MDVTLVIDGLDLSRKLSTYLVTQEVSYRKVVTTLDDVEHPYPGAVKSVVTFSMLPLTDSESADLYSKLSSLIVNATFTNQHNGMDETKRVRVVSDIESKFLLLSVDGKRRYLGGEIQLRAL